MAPGLNGRQTGTVPKNRARNSGPQSNRTIREALIQSTSLEWEPVLDQNSRSKSQRKMSSTHSEAEADSIRFDAASSLPPLTSSQMRFEDDDAEGNNQDIHGAKIRVNVPDKKQVINKITQIQDYIQRTATLMNALKTSACPEKINEFQKLSGIMDGLKDSEAKLIEILNNIDSSEFKIGPLKEASGMVQSDNNISNSDNNEEELVRRSEESKKKLELLQKRKQELIELQEKARKQLQEAQLEQSRLIARANTLNQDINSNKFLDLNVQQLAQRLKNAQQLYKTSNQINGSLGNDAETNREDIENLDEDQIEISDTETDFQIVSDKVAELNAMKSQLAHIQKIMANISLDSSTKEVNSGAEIVEERKEQAGQQQKFGKNDIPSDENTGNALKLEQAKAKLNQLTQFLEMAQSTQNSKISPSDYLQGASNLSNAEGSSIRRTPSPSYSGKSQQRRCDETYVETMQLMTRELEQRAAAMKEEHEKLIAARQELKSLARKIPLVKPERIISSPNDSESEAPSLTNITPDTNGRVIQTKAKQRGVWNALAPTINLGPSEKKCKNDEILRILQQNSELTNGIQQEQSGRSPSPTVSFYGTSNSALVTNPVEKSDNLCGRMISEVLQRTVRPEEVTIEELYAQHQMLTRTVAQCSQLLWLQQKQIIELRNTLLLQQSTMCQNILPQSNFGSQSQRNVPQSHHPFQFNPLPNIMFPPLVHPPQMPVQQQEQNYLLPNQSIKLNSSMMHNAQTAHDFPEQFFHHGANASMPFSVHDSLDFQFRYGNYNRPYGQQINSNLNVNQNLNQNMSSSLNNRIPLGGMNGLNPEDSRALNNQVPPGNRANNYWDNFRSYSRQNLLSHSKSNEDTDANRRASTSVNQERPLRETPSIVIQNNAPSVSSNDPTMSTSNCGTFDVLVQDESQFISSHVAAGSRHGQVQISRSRSADPQSHRNSAKNDSRYQENDSRNLNPKNESGAINSRTRNTEQVCDIRSVRNDVNLARGSTDNVNSSRNFVQLVSDLDSDERRHSINKRKPDKSRSRNEERENLNNRANTNYGLPATVRDNVYSEMTNFIRANENRPDFLIQLFRDLQQVTTDPLRQRTLESIQQTVSANNLIERSNINGSNINIIDNRNNIRESRSNLNRNQVDEPSRRDDLVCQIRENQNTIRQSIGSNSVPINGGNNLENPNISNLRNLGGTRNNLENEGLRDLRTYYEANLCNFGHNSALENPNLSNIRENLTRRGTAASEFENGNPKNLYLSMYDNAGRRNQDCVSDFTSGFQNVCNLDQRSNDFQCGNDFSPNTFQEMAEGETEVAGAAALIPPECSGNALDGGSVALPTVRLDSGSCIPPTNSLNRGTCSSPPNSLRDERCSPINPIENVLYGCGEIEQLDNQDLAEADQSRNEETPGLEPYNDFGQFYITENCENFIDVEAVSCTETEGTIEAAATNECTGEMESNWGGGAREAESEVSFQWSTSEPEGNYDENSEYQLG